MPASGGMWVLRPVQHEASVWRDLLLLNLFSGLGRVAAVLRKSFAEIPALVCRSVLFRHPLAQRERDASAALLWKVCRQAWHGTHMSCRLGSSFTLHANSPLSFHWCLTAAYSTGWKSLWHTGWLAKETRHTAASIITGIPGKSLR